jgi:hypothetical protein
MERGSERTIVCREVPDSRTVRSFIEKRVRAWLRGHGYDDTSTRYQVTLDREGGGHLIFCQVEVVVEAPEGKQERWIGSWSAFGLHQALMKTLNHMNHGPTFASARA